MKQGAFIMALTFSGKYAESFYNQHELNYIATQVADATKQIADRTGAGNLFLGWVDLPEQYDREEFARIKAAAAKIQGDTDIFIVIGIGGSYLGARAAIEFLKSPLYNALTKTAPKIYFAGNSISGSQLSELLTLCEGKRVSINVVSKSGTTTEPAIAFRVLRDYLETHYGKEEARGRIYCTTDRARGTLKALADSEGYQSFVVPDDVGGRFSVLTACGLLPIAVCGADIDRLMAGARAARTEYLTTSFEENACLLYAALRNLFYRRGYQIELVAAYEPRFAMMAEWFKQLYGESEGKDHKGLFPASVIFSTDLHSMGQYVQDGARRLFETVVRMGGNDADLTLVEAADDGDGLNFLAGKTMSYVNDKACEGTLLAHNDGGVPNLVITLDCPDEEHLGRLVYFYEYACAVSGYLLGVNPFDQPGVEAYKRNMFALLGKPGYEEERAKLEARLSN